MLFSPEQLVPSLQREIEHREYSVSSSQNEWNKRYFYEHKSRYISDLGIIERFYKEGQIVEIGALPCHMTYCLQKAKLPYTSIDIDPSRASIIIERNHLNVIPSDIEKEPLPFADDHCSFVIFNEVFEHLRINPIQTLKEIHRIVQPEGILLLTTPNLYSLGNIVRFILGKGFGEPYAEFEKLEKFGHMGHVREYSKRDMKEFLEKAGFHIQEHHFTYYSAFPSLKERIKQCIYRLAYPFRPYMIFIAQKK